MKIALCSAVWGRVPLTRVWWRGIERVVKTFREAGIEAQAFVSGSESAHGRLHLKYEESGVAAPWVEAPNRPLGHKWNLTAQAALAWDADYLFILGSDDFFDDRMVREYARLAQSGMDYAAMRTIYMFEPSSGRAILFDNAKRLKPSPVDGPHDGKVQIVYLGASKADPAKVTMGAGRLIHRKFFEGHSEFWEPQKSRALDASMQKLLQLPEAHIISSDIGIAVDVKTEENIWPLDDLIEWYPDCALPDTTVLSSLPEWDDIRSLAAASEG